MPNAQHMPTRKPQRSRHKVVTGFVAGKFVAPVCAVAFGVGCMLRTAMPETPVHENGKFKLPENKIWFSKHLLISPPALNAMPSKQFCQRLFCIFISAAANPRHYIRPFRFGKNIRHGLAAKTLLLPQLRSCMVGFFSPFIAPIKLGQNCL